MNHLIASIKNSIASQNWYAAFTLAMTLPDIAGKIEYPSEKSSKKRYSMWFENYMDGYRRFHPVAKKELVFMTGEDCYALRCAFLHEGSFDISSQSARETLDKFQLNVPGPKKIISHRNRIGNELHLDTQKFCIEIIEAIEKWKTDISSNEEKVQRLNTLMKMVQLI